MRIGILHYLGVTLLGLTTVAIVLAIGSASAAAITTAPLTWVDDFASSSLNGRWSWVREDPTHWSLTANPGFLRTVAQPGGLFQDGNNARNLLFRPAPPGPYQITTKVTMMPTENFQGAAIYVYQDDDNFLRLSRRYGNGDTVDLRLEVDGVAVTVSLPESATTVYLRIAREGDSYTASYGTDGSSWTLVGGKNMQVINPKVGIGSGCGPSTTEIPADFDYFQLEDSSHHVFLPAVNR